MSDGGGACKYSCQTATETLEWIHAIIDVLEPYRFFLDAHVVNFFKDRMWEAVDNEWMDCSRKEPVEKLMQIPSGVIQGSWPVSLKEYVLKLRSLAFPRDQADLQKAFPGLREAPLNNVIAQGMNQKKKHEIEALAAVIGSIARRVGAHTLVDVGSGQGYIAQVLSFEYELPVIAIDASSHHGGIADARARRIEKYYAAKMRKSRRSESKSFSLPKTVTCRVLPPTMLKDVSSTLVQVDDSEKGTLFRENVDEEPLKGTIGSEYFPLTKANDTLLVLAGLHACGDLSVTMLRTFMECDEVKAMVSIGCCYNLFSEGGIKENNYQCGFPVSTGSTSAKCSMLNEPSYPKSSYEESCSSVDRYSMFVKFCNSGLDRIGLHDSQEIDFSKFWKEAEEFSELVGPYWTLRAAIGPVVETLLLLDRLLFLQEQGNVFQASLVPLFDPLLSPRNLALIAEKM